MKNTAFITFVAIMVFVSSLESAKMKPHNCIPKSGKCDTQRSQDCCTKYCRDQVCIEFGDSSDDAGASKNPCNQHCCSDGEICVLHQVQCIRAPCPPIMRCANVTKPGCPA